MTISPRPEAPAEQVLADRHDRSSSTESDRQLTRWGGFAGLAGVASMIGAVIVVVAFGLPDASDPETLTDFADIESGRIAEHVFYLGALMLFALHLFVLRRLLDTAHAAASLFGTVMAGFGLVIMAASSMLHLSTAPLSDLYTDPDTPTADLPAIEYAWHGAQSVFDTMLVTGLLLAPIGIVLLGVAMRGTPAFGRWIASTAIVLGALGIIGATIEIVAPGSDLSALSVFAMVVFFSISGWRTLRLGGGDDRR